VEKEPSAEESRVELLETSTTLYDIVTLWNRNIYFPGYIRANPKIRQIAEETGGAVAEIQRPWGPLTEKAVPSGQRSISITNAMAQLISELHTQYALGFNPSNPGLPKTFHELKVKFTNKNRCPNCRMTARKGYYSGVASLQFPFPQVSTAEALSPQVSQELVRQSIIVAGTTPYDFDEISFKLSNSEQKTDEQAQSIKLDLEISPENVHFEAKGGIYVYRLLATFCYFDKWGKSLGSDSWTFSRSLSENAYQDAIKKGIQHSVSIPLNMLKQITKIVIYEEKGDRLGSRFIVKKGNRYVTEYHSPYGRYQTQYNAAGDGVPLSPRKQ
jgi:hypothetical protein